MDSLQPPPSTPLSSTNIPTVASLTRKLANLKTSHADTLRQLQESHQRAQRLTSALGFSDIYEAQAFLDTADGELNYKEVAQRVGELEDEVARLSILVTKEPEEIQRDLCHTGVQVPSSPSSSEAQNRRLTALQSRYDTLLHVKERAANRYKSDYKKWREFKRWIFDNDPASNKGLSNEVFDKKRKVQEMYGHTKEATGEGLASDEEGENEQVGRVLPPPLSPLKRKYPTHGKENDTPKSASATAKRLTLSTISNSPSKHSQAPTSSTVGTQNIPSKHLSINPVSNASMVPTPTSMRRPLVFKPIITDWDDKDQVKDEPSSSPTVPDFTTPTSQRNGSFAHSSDTEEDTQSLNPHRYPYPRTPKVAPAPIPAAQTASNVTTKARANSPQFKVPNVPASARREAVVKPEPVDFMAANPPLKSIATTHIQQGKQEIESQLPIPSSSKTVASERTSPLFQTTLDFANASPVPRKMRRIGEDDIGRGGPRYRAALDTPPTVSSLATPSDTKGKGKETDYSVFKGRGRYGMTGGNSALHTPTPASTSSVGKGKGMAGTINGTYVINAANNGGVDYMYEEVVRSKEARKRMEAGDCECCRGYYEAVGPLPARLQQPLWKSPSPSVSSGSSSPAPAKPCPKHQPREYQQYTEEHEEDGEPEPNEQNEQQRERERPEGRGIALFAFQQRQHMATRTPTSTSTSTPSTSKSSKAEAMAISNHRNAISRHRHHWARGSTPPGYWSIGFPDTQEAERINEEAREMHERKRMEVEREARNGGRWKKRT